MDSSYYNSLMEASKSSRENNIKEEQNRIQEEKNQQENKIQEQKLELQKQELQVQQQQAQTQQMIVIGGLSLAALLVLIVGVYLLSKVFRKKDKQVDEKATKRKHR